LLILSKDKELSLPNLQGWQMKIIEIELPGVKIIELDAFPDDRGYFMERRET
jgi:hypothetical protein